MLRKRTRSLQKDQSMPDNPPEKVGQQHHKTTNPLFSIPGLFVGLSSKAFTDSDSVRSPTSPLEFRVFSNVGNSFRCSRSVHDENPKSQEGCCKVGLGIIDSLDDGFKMPGKVLRPSESKNILFGPRIRTKTSSGKIQGESFEVSRSLPKNFAILSRTNIKSPLQKGSSDVVFEIGDAPLESKPESVTLCPSDSSVDSNADRNGESLSGNIYVETVTSQLSSPSVKDDSLDLEKSLHTPQKSSSNGLMGSLSASEIELSEDYTCVISHGPNPKTTHIFCDCVLEDCQAKRLIDSSKKEDKDIGLPQPFASSEVPPPPSNDFLSFCNFCKKKLEDDQDIYIYRGDKAFCSMECRCEAIFIEEEREKSTNKSDDAAKSDNGRKLFEPGVFVKF